jgi:Tfp pilus assembly protein PilV
MTMRIRHQRRGAILAAAMVCLLIIMLFAAAVARSILLRQQTTRVGERQVQCFWFAESAAMRAISKSRADPAYRGEVWKVTAQAHDVTVQGAAEIQVEVVPGAENRRHVKISARWPDVPIERVVRTKEFEIQLGSIGAAP